MLPLWEFLLPAIKKGLNCGSKLTISVKILGYVCHPSNFTYFSLKIRDVTFGEKHNSKLKKPFI